MQEIIEISKQIIGAEETNSVNAREIHEYLGVKTVFANWIQRAIKKYDFLENVDYMVIAKNGKNLKGGRPIQEYIVTIDMGKELAMLENNAKGKETRKYFIAVEKEYQLGNSNAGSELMPAIETMVKLMHMIFENQQTQEKEMFELKKEMLEIKVDIRSVGHTQEEYILVRQDNRADYITPIQADTLVEIIDAAAIYIAKYHRLDVHTSKRLIFGKFNSKFNIKKYNHLKAVNFNKAKAYLTQLKDKARLLTDTEYKNMIDTIVDIFEEEE